MLPAGSIKKMYRGCSVPAVNEMNRAGKAWACRAMSKTVISVIAFFVAVSSASAAMVWAVPSGDTPGLSSQGTIDVASSQTGSADFLIDIYLDTEGSQVYGWDLLLSTDGAGLIGDVAGTLLGTGALQTDGSYRQFGSADLAITPLSGDAVLLMTFRWSGFSPLDSVGLASTSNIVDDAFNTVFLPGSVLATAAASPIPLPASLYLFCSAIAFLQLTKRSHNEISQ